jgi:hypothetical protein
MDDVAFKQLHQQFDCKTQNLQYKRKPNGMIVAIHNPYAVVVPISVLEELKKKGELPTLCGVCSEVASKRCGRCRGVTYCSVECQKLDWKTHRFNCVDTELNG